MSTTSLKLSRDLKKRITAVATGRGVTPHAFMVEALEASARAAERRSEFVAEAKAARRKLMRTGKGYDGDAVQAYLRGRVQGEKPARPRATNWRD